MNRLALSNHEMIIREAYVNFICNVQNKKPRTAKHFYESMERYLPRFMEEKMNINVHSIYEITNIGTLQMIHDRILNTPEWKQYNEHSRGSTMTLGLRYYIALLKSEYYPYPGEVIHEENVADNTPGLIYTEGRDYSICNNRYERNEEARNACIQHYGCKCAVCGFDFEMQYGELGKGYIEVHHIVPLSNIREEYNVDPIRDLIPLCSNCHSIIHRLEPTIHPDELRDIILKNR